MPSTYIIECHPRESGARPYRVSVPASGAAEAFARAGVKHSPSHVVSIDGAPAGGDGSAATPSLASMSQDMHAAAPLPGATSADIALLINEVRLLRNDLAGLKLQRKPASVIALGVIFGVLAPIGVIGIPFIAAVVWLLTHNGKL